MTDWQPDTSDEWPEITEADIAAHIAAYEAWLDAQHIASACVRYYEPFKPLNRCERAVFQYIWQIEGKYQIANPSIAQIMAGVPYSERHIQRALAHMEAMGVLGVDRATDAPKEGDAAPQRWARPITLRGLEQLHEMTYQSKTLPQSKEMAPSIKYTELAPLTRQPMDAEYKWQAVIDEHTAQWNERQARRRCIKQKPPAPIHFPPDPEWYACFFWDDTHEQAA